MVTQPKVKKKKTKVSVKTNNTREKLKEQRKILKMEYDRIERSIQRKEDKIHFILTLMSLGIIMTAPLIQVFLKNSKTKPPPSTNTGNEHRYHHDYQNYSGVKDQFNLTKIAKKINIYMTSCPEEIKEDVIEIISATKEQLETICEKVNAKYDINSKFAGKLSPEKAEKYRVYINNGCKLAKEFHELVKNSR